MQSLSPSFAQSPTFSYRAFRALLCTLGMLVSAYIFFLGMTVFNIVHIKSAELSIKSISSEINALEQAYISETSAIDLAYAVSLGFIEPEQTLYASRDNRVAVGAHVAPHEL